MIVFEDRKLVIITPPHTASGNMHRACSALGARWVIGPTPDGAECDHHTAAIAAGWRDYRVALVIRHPLDRLIGLYEHHETAGLLEANQWKPLVFWEFVAMALERHRDLSWFYRTPIAELIGDTRIDELIRFESLAVDAERVIGEPLDLPVDRHDVRDLSDYYRQINVCLMAELWGAADLDQFSYRSRFDPSP